MRHTHHDYSRNLIARLAFAAGCLALGVCLVLASATPTDAQPRWRTTRSEHFTAIGDAGDARLRDVLARLEQFREVLRRVSPGLNLTPPQPIVVVVFENQRSLKPFAPLYEGRPVDVGGVYVNGVTTHFMALDVARGSLAYPVIFHEFAHLFLRNTLAEVPVWFNEGLAGFYETFELGDGNRSATIGRANGPYVAKLRERMLPLDELLAVTASSPLYNEGDRRSIFYAQAWALTHYLLVGNQERAKQLPVYLQALIDGTDEPTAFATAFGATTSQIGAELSDYVRQMTFTAIRYNLSATVDELAIPRPQPMSDADATAILAEFQYMVKRKDEARTRLAAALATTPDHPGLLRTRALFDILDERPADAIAALDPLVADPAADAATLEVAARAHLSPRPDLVATDDLDASQLKARDLLTRAVALEPDRATAHEMLARLHLRRDGNAKLAEYHARTALSLAPVRTDVLFVVADAMVKQEKFVEARNTLGTYMARTADRDLRERIRSHLARVADYERRVLEARATDRALPPAPVTADAEMLPVGPGQTVPVYRELKDGEVRVEGTLIALECGPRGVTVVADTGDGRQRFPPTDFADIAFITYRADVGGEVRCGPWTGPERVMVTWKPSGTTTAQDPALKGSVVALEFPPSPR